jgi:hypothetical protein
MFRNSVHLQSRFFNREGAKKRGKKNIRYVRRLPDTDKKNYCKLKRENVLIYDDGRLLFEFGGACSAAAGRRPRLSRKF